LVIWRRKTVVAIDRDDGARDTARRTMGAPSDRVRVMVRGKRDQTLHDDGKLSVMDPRA
jgi:hypothetical protein